MVIRIFQPKFEIEQHISIDRRQFGSGYGVHCNGFSREMDYFYIHYIAYIEDKIHEIFWGACVAFIGKIGAKNHAEMCKYLALNSRQTQHKNLEFIKQSFTNKYVKSSTVKSRFY